jgi:hypothetical protein
VMARLIHTVVPARCRRAARYDALPLTKETMS